MDDILKLLLEIKENMVTKEELKRLPTREDFVDLKVDIQDLKNRVANIENKMVTQDEFVNGLNEVYQGIETITLKVSEKLEEHEERLEDHMTRIFLSSKQIENLESLLRKLKRDDDQPESQV